MVEIRRVKAREIIDSRGNPTIEVELATREATARGLVPSGASTGTHEALELRDGGSRFFGKGVTKAVANVNTTLRSRLEGQAFTTQEELDRLLNEIDGTPNKATLGANALLGISLAFSRLHAHQRGVPLHVHLASFAGTTPRLPLPQFNVLNGGTHAGFVRDIQEHMIVPRGPFPEALQYAGEVYHRLGETLKERFGAAATHLADEGGYAPQQLRDTRARLDLLMHVIEELGHDVSLALDAAASEFFEDGKYLLGDRSLSAGELVDVYRDLAATYPLVSLEDGMAEEDWEGWQELTRAVNIQIVGDDLLVTNPERIRTALEKRACNALLLKVNQIGTVTETLEATRLALDNGWKIVVSHRSGETEDPFIADLAVALGDQCKFGAPARGERTAKYNQLLRLAENLTQ